MKKLFKNLKFFISDTVKEVYPISVSKIAVLIIKRHFKSFGKGSTITMPTIIEGKKNVEIGENTAIGAFVHIWGNGGVKIGNRVLIASHTSIVTVTHDPSKHPIKKAEAIFQPISIEDDVWIGSHAVIMPGITIGQGAIVGAGTVVTKDVPPFSVFFGVPGKLNKYRNLT